MRTPLVPQQASIYADEASAHPLLCTLTVRRQHGAAQQMPEYDTIGWHGQAMASLAAAMVLGESEYCHAAYYLEFPVIGFS